MRLVEDIPTQTVTRVWEPSDGCLCWGGPHHGEVTAIPDSPPHDVWLFAIPRRVSASDSPDAGVNLSVATVAYSLRKYGVRYKDGDRESWRVLVYQENEERLARHLDGAAHAVMWMCDPL